MENDAIFLTQRSQEDITWPELSDSLVLCNWIWQINQASQIRVPRLAEKYNLFHDEFPFKYEKGKVILIKQENTNAIHLK